MSIKKFVGAAFCRPLAVLAALALSAILVVGCGDDDNGGDDGKIPGNGDGSLTPAQIQEIDGRLGAGASRLVGEWVFEHDIVEDNYIGVTSLKSSGDACWIEFQKADDFWLESETCGGTWRVEDSYLIINDNYNERMMYSVSGSNLTLIGCRWEDGEEECDIDRATKFDRNSIGATRIAKHSADKRDKPLFGIGRRDARRGR